MITTSAPAQLNRQFILMGLRRYVALFSISWQNGLVYKTAFLMWRLRMVIGTLLPLALWSAVYTQSDQAFGYTQSEMIGYILLSNLSLSLIMSTGLHDIPYKVYSGELSLWLIKPMGIFRYYLLVDLADKMKNFFFVMIETMVFWFFLAPMIGIPSASVLLLAIFWILLGVAIHFWIELLFGAIGFWSPDVWGPKFLFFMVIDIAAGRSFPLDIFPPIVDKILFMTPFPYFGFVQTQLLLGRIPSQDFIPLTASMLLWMLVLGALAWVIWRRGLRDYSAAGR